MSINLWSTSPKYGVKKIPINKQVSLYIQQLYKNNNINTKLSLYEVQWVYDNAFGDVLVIGDEYGLLIGACNNNKVQNIFHANCWASMIDFVNFCRFLNKHKVTINKCITYIKYRNDCGYDEDNGSLASYMKWLENINRKFDTIIINIPDTSLKSTISQCKRLLKRSNYNDTHHIDKEQVELPYTNNDYKTYFYTYSKPILTSILCGTGFIPKNPQIMLSVNQSFEASHLKTYQSLWISNN